MKKSHAYLSMIIFKINTRGYYDFITITLLVFIKATWKKLRERISHLVISRRYCLNRDMDV